MIWKVKFAESARRDIKGIYAYIRDTLKEPRIAAAQIARIKKATNSLDNMPMRHQLYAHEPWRSMGFRTLPTGNYVILYCPNETANIVNIIRIIYGGRDIQEQLDQTQ